MKIIVRHQPSDIWENWRRRRPISRILPLLLHLLPRLLLPLREDLFVFYTRCSTYQCNHFMCTTGQLLIYDSAEGKAELPTPWFMPRDFSLSLLSRVETTFVYAPSRIAIYLDLLIPSRVYEVMSFKCLAQKLSRALARELSCAKGHMLIRRERWLVKKRKKSSKRATHE